MKYKYKDGGVVKLQKAGIMPKIKRLVQSAAISKGLRTSKLQGFKPVGEDLYKASVTPGMSSYYADVPIFGINASEFKGYSFPELVSPENGVDFLSKRDDEWNRQIRVTSDGLQYVSNGPGSYAVPLGYQKVIPSGPIKYEYRPITSDQFARTINYVPSKRPSLDEINSTWKLGDNNIRILPGLHLQSTMRGAPIEKLIAPDGTIHVNQLRKYFSTASKSDQAVVAPILEQLHDRVGYNEFRKRVQDALGNFDLKYTYHFADYGMPNIGQDKMIRQIPDGAGGLVDVPINPDATKARTLLFTADPRYYGLGSTKHFSEGPLGHVRRMITVEEPSVYHILESQSDKYQHFTPAVQRQQVKLQYPVGPKMLDPEEETGLMFNEATASYEPALVGKPSLKVKDIPDTAWGSIGSDVDLDYLPSTPQEVGLSRFWEERQLLEAMRDAVNGGQTKIRFPIDETAAKIEGYGAPQPPATVIYPIPGFPQLDVNTVRSRLRKKERSIYQGLLEDAQDAWEKNGTFGISQDYYNFVDRILKTYSTPGRRPEHEDVLQHYRMFPKRLKNIGIDDYRIVTDPKGIQWYEFDIPQSFLDKTAEYRAFTKGGKI